jgi:hypothetical protein
MITSASVIIAWSSSAQWRRTKNRPGCTQVQSSRRGQLTAGRELLHDASDSMRSGDHPRGYIYEVRTERLDEIQAWIAMSAATATHADASPLPSKTPAATDEESSA